MMSTQTNKQTNKTALLHLLFPDAVLNTIGTTVTAANALSDGIALPSNLRENMSRTEQSIFIQFLV